MNVHMNKTNAKNNVLCSLFISFLSQTSVVRTRFVADDATYQNKVIYRGRCGLTRQEMNENRLLDELVQTLISNDV